MTKKKRKTTKKTKKQEKNNYLFLIISFILIIIIYLINSVNVIRPILWLIAIGLITYYLNKILKLNIKKITCTFLILLLISLVLDAIIVSIFKRVPAYTYNIVSNDKVKVYYSPGLKVWQCESDSKLSVYEFFESGYMCDASDIAEIDSNSFLNSVVSNYEEYHNQYVKIKGKISKKNGETTLEMKPYTETTSVEFADNITLIIFFEDEDLTNYDVYDEITVIGLIKNLEESDGKYTVYMTESKIVGETDLTSFTISANQTNNCNDNLLSLVTNENYNLYSYCLDDIIVTFPENVYELSDALSGNKINIEDVYKDYLEVVSNEDDGSKLYRMETYNVIECNPENSKDIYVGSLTMNFNNIKCNPISEN